MIGVQMTNRDLLIVTYDVLIEPDGQSSRVVLPYEAPDASKGGSR